MSWWCALLKNIGILLAVCNVADLETLVASRADYINQAYEASQPHSINLEPHT